jgi:hypothetical protein
VSRTSIREIRQRQARQAPPRRVSSTPKMPCRWMYSMHEPPTPTALLPCPLQNKTNRTCPPAYLRPDPATVRLCPRTISRFEQQATPQLRISHCALCTSAISVPLLLLLLLLLLRPLRLGVCPPRHSSLNSQRFFGRSFRSTSQPLGHSALSLSSVSLAEIDTHTNKHPPLSPSVVRCSTAPTSSILPHPRVPGVAGPS